MKHFVYVLWSTKDGEFYVGCTADIVGRLAQHNSGMVKSTRHRAPLRLIYTESYDSKYPAFRREKYYKTAKGKKELKGKLGGSSLPRS